MYEGVIELILVAIDTRWFKLLYFNSQFLPILFTNISSITQYIILLSNKNINWPCNCDVIDGEKKDVSFEFSNNLII